MLYALDRNELKQLRNANWTAELTGAEMLAAVFRTDQKVLEQILPDRYVHRLIPWPLRSSRTIPKLVSELSTMRLPYSFKQSTVAAQGCIVYRCPSMMTWQWLGDVKSSVTQRRWQNQFRLRSRVPRLSEAQCVRVLKLFV